MSNYEFLFNRIICKIKFSIIVDFKFKYLLKRTNPNYNEYLQFAVVL